MTQNNGFIRLDHDLVRSGAWTRLSANATRLLIGIWDQYNGRNNGELRYSYQQAMRLLRCSPRTAKRVFAERRVTGLIEEVEKGSFKHQNGARKGMATAWRITAIRENRKPVGRRSPKSFNGVSDGR